MIIYKLEDRFDPKTGKKTGTHRVYDHVICDFSGVKGNFQEDLGNAYEVDYGGLDPCIGCMDVEHRIAKKWKFNAYELTGPYHIDEENVDLMDMIEAYEKDEEEKPRWISHLFRWARNKTVDRLLMEGVYTLEQFGIEVYDDDDDDDDDD
jgi:hypothetical protein